MNCIYSSDKQNRTIGQTEVGWRIDEVRNRKWCRRRNGGPGQTHCSDYLKAPRMTVAKNNPA